MSRFRPENFSREPDDDPYDRLSWWDRLVVWYFEDFRYKVRKFFGMDDGPRGVSPKTSHYFKNSVVYPAPVWTGFCLHKI